MSFLHCARAVLSPPPIVSGTIYLAVRMWRSPGILGHRHGQLTLLVIVTLGCFCLVVSAIVFQLLTARQVPKRISNPRTPRRLELSLSMRGSSSMRAHSNSDNGNPNFRLFAH